MNAPNQVAAPRVLNAVFGQAHGGRWRMFCNYHDYLQQGGCEVFSVSNQHDGELPLALQLSVSGHYDLKAAWRLRRFLKQHKIQLAVCHCARSLGALKLAAFALGIPVIGVAHSINVKRMARADYNIAIAEHIKQRMLKFSQREQNIFVLPNCVEEQGLQPVSSSPRSPGQLTIGMISRMEEEKGFAVVLEAFNLLHKNYPELRLHFAGDGPMREALQQRCRDLALEHKVSIEGWYANSADFYAKVDIACLASRREAFALTILEAWRAGLPVVASAIDGNVEALDAGKCGVLVEDYTKAEAWAAAFVELLESAQRRQQLAEAGQQRYLQCYSPRQAVPQLAAIVRRVLEIQSKGTAQ